MGCSRGKITSASPVIRAWQLRRVPHRISAALGVDAFPESSTAHFPHTPLPPHGCAGETPAEASNSAKGLGASNEICDILYPWRMVKTAIMPP